MLSGCKHSNRYHGLALKFNRLLHDDLLERYSCFSLSSIVLGKSGNGCYFRRSKPCGTLELSIPIRCCISCYFLNQLAYLGRQVYTLRRYNPIPQVLIAKQELLLELPYSQTPSLSSITTLHCPSKTIILLGFLFIDYHISSYIFIFLHRYPSNVTSAMTFVGTVGTYIYIYIVQT
ncbi:hypothetical protein BDP27DRAFT_426794 [Rhodocollybia butyracea]|uniref:Uncharacterized protein n=1 Tax=Rhodocollybia butyracea TaxID=206335 RepID=A0A9P5Q2D8_9AGAR|nr:hypothetical protein BDP27DRAFT_426794 [Rhodocollybia butyracea]